MNTLADVLVDDKGNPIKLNEWQVDEDTGEKTMYTRVQTIPFCDSHVFDRNHECTKCPYIFTGFKSHEHIQKADGIYNRQTGKKVA